jgi:hypothetical protein
MGFWLALNMAKLLPFLKKGIFYQILDEKNNWNFGFAKLKKGERKFVWRGKEYNTPGFPERLNVIDEKPPSLLQTLFSKMVVPTQYETSVGLRFYMYFHDCPYPINAAFDPNAEHLVSFREMAETDQLIRTNHERRAFEKASLLTKKNDQQQLFLILGVIALQTLIVLYFLFKISAKLSEMSGA